MAPTKERTLTVQTYEDFRDLVPNSGVFDMTDCKLEIWCPEHSQVDEVQRMVHLLESMVHVTDVVVGSDIENLTSDNYRVVITEVSPDIRKKYAR